MILLEDAVRDFLTTIPDLWSSGKIEDQLRAFYCDRDGNFHEIEEVHKAMQMMSGLMPFDVIKDGVASFLRDFCAKEKPLAIATAFDAWMTIAKGENVDVERLPDPEYRKMMGLKRKQTVTCMIETREGYTQSYWLVNEDRSLASREQHIFPKPAEDFEKHSRFAGMLP